MIKIEKRDGDCSKLGGIINVEARKKILYIGGNKVTRQFLEAKRLEKFMVTLNQFTVMQK